MKGLYEQYRLSNSSVIPMFTGTTAPEALKIGEHLQSVYDVARAGGEELEDSLGNLQSMPTQQDVAMKNKLKSTISGQIKKMSESGDWENQLGKVKSLARLYSNRAMELAAPLAQYKEYEKSLDDKDKNLTPEMKKILLSRSLYGYEGLQEDPSGKLVGSFNGIEPAKNIDVNQKVDTWLSKIAADEGGSEIASDNGEWKIRRNGKWEKLEGEKIKRTLSYAMANDTEYQAYKSMMGANAGFMAMSQIKSLDDLNPAIRTEVEEQVNQGISLSDAVHSTVKRLQENSIEQLANAYAVSKYQFSNRWSSSESGIGDVAKAREIDALNNTTGIFDAVTDVGQDLTAKYGSASDIEKQIKTNAASIEQAQTEVNASRAAIARYYLEQKYKVKNFSDAVVKKSADGLTDEQVRNYYTKEAPNELGRYNAAVQSVENAKQSQNELNQIRETAMDMAVRKKYPGTTFDGLKKEATNTLREIITNDGVVLKAGNLTIDKNNVNDYEVIDGDVGSGNPANYVTIKNKTTGKTLKVQTKSTPGLHSGDADITIDNKKLRDAGKKFDGISWKDEWSNALTNIRSNSVVFTLTNLVRKDGKTSKAGAYAERTKAMLSAGAGGLEVFDLNGQKKGSSDDKDMKARISAGAFTVKGFTKRDNGKLYVKLSVVTDKSATDPGSGEEEVLVAADTDLATKLSRDAITAAVQDGDMRSVQVAAAMMPGSGYEQVLNIGTTGRLQVTDYTGGKKGDPLYEVVTNPTGSSSGALTYELYKVNNKGERMGHENSFSDAFELGFFLDKQREGGTRVIEKKTSNK